ncbi:MAG: DnaJ C-terminal domain-containing protein, partial [Candidatus Liptonbacteria bacterium]
EASQDEIKKAYRKLAHQYHPDKSGGDESRFKEINEAYQVLSDASKRSNYDQFGSADPTQGFSGGGWYGRQSGFGGFPGGFPGGFQNGVNIDWEDLGDLGDVVENIFEGLGVRPKRQTYRRGSDIELEETITLEEAFRGIEKRVHYKTLLTCSACKGEGGDQSAGSKQCATCNGRGEIREERQTFFGNFAQVRTCSACKGRGNIPNKLCSACKGAGRIAGERDVTFQILSGIQDKQIIKIQGMGEAGEKITGTGDLYVHVRVKPHSIFKREGENLVVDKELKVLDLLLGHKISVPTISGKTIELEIPAHFNLKERLRVKGEGMPILNGHGRGDLLIDFIIKAPKKLGAKEAKLLEELGEQ